MDGPTHFLYQTTRPSGATLLKRRQLQRAGWRMVWVPYFDWRSAQRDASSRATRDAMRRRYVAGLLGVDDGDDDDEEENDEEAPPPPSASDVPSGS